MTQLSTDVRTKAEPNPFEVNSPDYWEFRFSHDWETESGPAQGRFFAELAAKALPGWLVEEIKREQLSVCDWGCAQGDGTAVLAGALGEERVWGIDIAQAAVDAARKRYPALKFEVADLAAAPSRRPIDVLFTSNTLEHFEKPFDLLEKLTREVRRYVVLLLPFAEKELFREHFFTFDERSIPLGVGDGFHLVYRAIYDTSKASPTYWVGKQALLIYARQPEDVRGLTLADLGPTERAQLIAGLEGRAEASSLNVAELYEAHRRFPQAHEQARTRRFEAAILRQQLADAELRVRERAAHVDALTARIGELEAELERRRTSRFGQLERMSGSAQARIREEGPVWLWRAVRRRVQARLTEEAAPAPAPAPAPIHDWPYASVQQLKEIRVDVEARRYEFASRHADFAVVITVRNEAKRIGQFLANLAEQTLLPRELVIVDGGSTDQTVALAEEWARLRRGWARVVRGGALNIAAGRNLGVSTTSAEVIVFVDAGCELEEDLFANLYGPMQDPSVDLTSGIYLASEVTEHARHFVRDWSAKTDWASFLPSARCMAVRAQTYRAVGGFPEFLTLTGEDTLFDVNYRRASKRWLVNTEARVYWHAPTQQAEAERLSARYVVGDGESGFGDFNFHRREQPAPGTVRAWQYAGYVEGRMRRASIEVNKRKIKGVVVLMSGVSISDIGGGQRSTQLALELIRHGYKVIFLNRYPRYGQQISKVFFDVDLSLLELYFHADFSAEDFARRYAHLDVPITVVTEFPHEGFFDAVQRLRHLIPRARYVFDYIDLWDSSLGGSWYKREVEDAMVRAADLVMASARTLVDALAPRSSKPVHLVANAVNAHVFSPLTAHARPADVGPRPYVLYVGSLYGDWFDWATMEQAARELPELDFAFVGDSHGVAKAEALAALPNVKFLGPRQQTALPPYLQHATVCVIPFRADSSITKFVNPLKVYEYLAMRRPVVATQMDELAGLPGVFLAGDAAEFVKQIDAAAKAKLDVAKVDAFVAANNWTARVRALEAALEKR